MLQTTLCNIKLENPTILASGILGVTKECVDRIGKCGAGAVTLKSLCHEERQGNPNPTMFTFKGGMLNAVGLPGQGIDNATSDFKQLNDISVPVIGSIYGYTVETFGDVTKKMAKLKPAMIEIDISCPHHDYGKPYYADVDLLSKVVNVVKQNAGSIPISTKLSPNVYNIAELAKAAQDAGSDAITAINTAIGMVIDLDMRRPILHNKVGGLSGPALKPIAVRCVYQIYEAVDIPIIGTGGVTSGEDAIEMIMAGATAVGVGTAAYYHGIDVFKKITAEMQDWMKQNNVKSLDEIRGCAHGHTEKK